MAVERRHVDDAVLGDVQVVIVLGDPEQVDLLRQFELAERLDVERDVGAAGLGDDFWSASTAPFQPAFSRP